MAIQMHAIIMRDKGLDKGLIREFNTSERDKKGWSKGFFGFRKMFWDYLKKLNVVFYDDCCPDANPTGSVVLPVRWNETLSRLEKYNGTAWVDITEIEETTTTTSTTTTTTV